MPVTDESGRFINRPYRVEDISIKNSNGFPAVSIIGRHYRRTFYDDQVTERLVPLPIVQTTANNTERGAAVIFQQGAATNTRITVAITNYTTGAKFRKVQIASNNNFTSNLVEFVHSAENEVGLILTNALTSERDTNLSSAETKFVRVAHSTNGVKFGAWSNVLEIGYPNAGGAGGTGGDTFPPSGGGEGTGGGSGGGHIYPVQPIVN